MLIKVGKGRVYEAAQYFRVYVPTEQTESNEHIYKEAQSMRERTKSPTSVNKQHYLEPKKKRKIGRNEPCPCGSGKKYKKCHGC